MWDYPRPPRLERTDRRIRAVITDVVLGDSIRAFRVLETSHPPTYYVPPEDVRMAIPDPYNPRYSYAGGKLISELIAIHYLSGSDTDCPVNWSSGERLLSAEFGCRCEIRFDGR